MHISYSQISGAAGCGERYRLERVVKVPQTPGWALVGGGAFHHMTEDFDCGREVQPFDHYLDREIEDRVDETGFPREEWRVSGRATKEWPDKEDERWWRYHGPLFFDRYVRWQNATPWVIAEVDGKPAVEVKVEMDFGEVDGEPVEFVGYIDRIFHDPRHDVYLIGDLKTGSREPVVPQQLADYAVALRETTGLDVNHGFFYDARKGMSSTVYDLSLYDVDRLAYRVRATASMRRHGIFLPNPTSMCVACSVKEFCFAWKQGDPLAVEQPVLAADVAETD